MSISHTKLLAAYGRKGYSGNNQVQDKYFPAQDARADRVGFWEHELLNVPATISDAKDNLEQEVSED